MQNCRSGRKSINFQRNVCVFYINKMKGTVFYFRGSGCKGCVVFFSLACSHIIKRIFHFPCIHVIQCKYFIAVQNKLWKQRHHVQTKHSSLESYFKFELLMNLFSSKRVISLQLLLQHPVCGSEETLSGKEHTKKFNSSSVLLSDAKPNSTRALDQPFQWQR